MNLLLLYFPILDAEFGYDNLITGASLVVDDLLEVRLDKAGDYKTEVF